MGDEPDPTVELTLSRRDGVGVVVTQSAAARLGASRTSVLEARTSRGPPPVTISRAPAGDATHVDEAGVAIPGRVVRGGDVLVGLVRGGPRFAGEAADPSLRVPPLVTARVGAVDASGGRTRVELVEDAPVEVGDTVSDGVWTEVVVGVVPDVPGVDGWWGGPVGAVSLRRVRRARDHFAARGVGPCSLVSAQPLGAGRTGARRVGPAELVALELRGAWDTALEWLTFKSDDVQGRDRARAALLAGEPLPPPGVPQSVEAWWCELFASAFATRDEPGGARRIGLADRQAILEVSRGEVVHAGTVEAGSRTARPGGLFCEHIFGAEVGSARTGHVTFAAPLLHPLATTLVGTLLDRPREVVRAVLDGAARVDGTAPSSWSETGANAVCEALAGLDLDALARGGGPRGRAAALVAGAGGAGVLFYDVWPVAPAWLRPMVPLSGDRWLTSDLNDLYAPLVTRARRWARLRELGAPDPICIAEQAAVQRALEDLVGSERDHPAPVDDRGRVLRALLPEAASRVHENLARKRVDASGAAVVVPDADVGRGNVHLPATLVVELLGPWVDLATRGLGAAAAERPVVVVPAASRRAPCAVGAFEIVVGDDGHAIGMHPADAEALGVAWGDEVSVFLPLGPAAVAEVRAWSAPDRPPAEGGAALFHRARRWVVDTPDCGATGTRTPARCKAEGNLCAVCSGMPMGTPIGSLAASAATEIGPAAVQAASAAEAIKAGVPPALAEVLFRPADLGWIVRAARARGVAELGETLFHAALRGEVDPVADAETRSLLGRRGATTRPR